MNARFACPSSVLQLRMLLKKGRRPTVVACLLALAVHLLLIQVTGVEPEKKVAKPLTTRFVKRQPRLTKPLEMKKRPRPKRRQLRREMVTVRARTTRGEVTTSVRPRELIMGLATPRARVERDIGLEHTATEPSVVAAAIEGVRENKEIVDIALEMMDIDALDTGQYQAMVVQDPDDRQGIKGFFHFYRAYPVSFVRGPSTRHDNQVFQDEAVRGLNKVIEAINRYTGIRADIKGSIHFDSEELFKTPFIYHLGTCYFILTPGEAMNLGRYMRVGGLLFADSISYGDRYPGDESNREIVRQSLNSVGLQHRRDWDFTQLPKEHAIYHSFFDFDGPPPGGHAPYRAQAKRSPSVGREVYLRTPLITFLEGVIIDERTWAVVCQKSYAKAWGEWGRPGTRNEREKKQDNRRQLQFGVNIIVFALTQDGSITAQLLDSLSY